jgi:hypothetical protein
MPKHRQCGVQQVNERLIEQHPELRARQYEIEEECRRAISEGVAQRVWRQLITLPVVVHVVYRTDEENIPDEQVTTQIEVLNDDYRARNADKDSVPDPWKSLVADPNIEFELKEITRTPTARDSFGTNDTIKRSSDGGVDPWPTDEYLNVWVCNLGGGLLGYAQFPGGPAETDGVVILYTAFGTTGAASEPFNLGRTATHEVGHWLNLRHIWGDRTDCSGTDEVSDTARAQMPNYGKPDWPHITCNNGPNGDMFMNYMDYVDDAAMFMFTHGQAARMNATLAGPRSSLAGL